MTPNISLLTDLDDARSVETEWDALAVSLGKPYCAPAWMLAWWEHVAPPGARLRIVVVRDLGELVGIAPFLEDRGPGGTKRWRLLGSGTSARLQPLATAEHTLTLAGALADAAVEGPADLVMFAGSERGSAWPQMVLDLWPAGRAPWMHEDESMAAPYLTLDGTTYEGWMASRSRSLRKQMSRVRRQLDGAGAVFKLAHSEQETDRALAAFAKLHRRRWRDKGGSGVLTREVEAMLRTCARRLPEPRFRVWTLEVDEDPIGAAVFVGAGGELAYWLGGFADEWGVYQPSLQVLLRAIEHAWSVGDQRVDLGAGGQDYKYRFADGEDDVAWTTLVPRTRSYVFTRARLAPAHLRLTLSARLSDQTKRKIRAMIDRSLRRGREGES